MNAAGGAHSLTLRGWFAIFEQSFEHQRDYANPYTQLTPVVELIEPDSGVVRRLPLFWDGGRTWRFRFSPDRLGIWEWRISSGDPGLDGRSGQLLCVESDQRGSLQPMSGYPHHFQFQNGEPCWFLGDTAWALYTDSVEERHDWDAVRHSIDVRSGQGFNVFHSMLLSEAGWGNSRGPGFHDFTEERINPGYWQEVDRRLAYLNEHGIVGGLALAWGNKGRGEPCAWDAFPNQAARFRYARTIAARYSAFDVYFIVAGEWHATIRTSGKSEEEVRRQYIEIGDALLDADPHGRMVAIHPMTQHGSVRKFVGTRWMRFGDYQQNYRDLHARILQSRKADLPMVNSEYGYYLRDQNGDGVPDKSNSTSADAMRHATWDIVMAGGYVVTGFGTTYFGGNRDPGPFDVDTPTNDVWEEEIGHVRDFFTRLEWWKLVPHDDWLTCEQPRQTEEGREMGQIVPPARTYWMLADPGQTYVVYMRGCEAPLTLRLGTQASCLHLFDPRTGEFHDLGTITPGLSFHYTPPDSQDWVLLLK